MLPFTYTNRIEKYKNTHTKNEHYVHSNAKYEENMQVTIENETIRSVFLHKFPN